MDRPVQHVGGGIIPVQKSRRRGRAQAGSQAPGGSARSREERSLCAQPRSPSSAGSIKVLIRKMSSEAERRCEPGQPPDDEASLIHWATPPPTPAHPTVVTRDVQTGGEAPVKASLGSRGRELCSRAARRSPKPECFWNPPRAGPGIQRVSPAGTFSVLRRTRAILWERIVGLSRPRASLLGDPVSRGGGWSGGVSS